MTVRWIDRGLAEDFTALIRQRGLAWQLYLASVAENRRQSGLGFAAPLISLVAHVALLGSVMSLVFREPYREFLPYFAISFALWQSLSTAISHMATANERAANFLVFPNISGFLLHLLDACDYVVGLVLKLAGSLVIIAVVSPVSLLGIDVPATAVGILLMTVALYAWALPFSFFFDRFRLLRAFLPQILYAVFLITPILWQPDRIQEHSWLYDYNPVFHLIEVVRVPVLEGSWPIVPGLVVILAACLGVLASIALYHRNRVLMVYRWIA